MLGVCTHAHESTLTQREIKEGQKDSQGKTGECHKLEKGRQQGPVNPEGKLRVKTHGKGDGISEPATEL